MIRMITRMMADYVHRNWSHWMKHFFTKGMPMYGPSDNQRGYYLSGEYAERWRRQMETPYEELSPEEQESDRKIAGEMIAAMDIDTAYFAIKTLVEAAESGNQDLLGFAVKTGRMVLKKWS